MAGTTRKTKASRPDPYKWKTLTSYVENLYDEMDKLSRKSPKELASDLAVKHVNRAIRDAKALLTGFDEYVGDLAEFVAAGENPEVRDLVLVLGEIKGALSRADSANGLFMASSGRRA